MSKRPFVISTVRLLLSLVEETVATRFYNNIKPREMVLTTTKNILANVNGRAVMDNETTGLYQMFQHKKEHELKRIYTLLFKSDHKNHFCSTFVSYIDKEGTDILDKISAEDEKMLKSNHVAYRRGENHRNSARCH